MIKESSSESPERKDIVLRAPSTTKHLSNLANLSLKECHKTTIKALPFRILLRLRKFNTWVIGIPAQPNEGRVFHMLIKRYLCKWANKYLKKDWLDYRTIFEKLKMELKASMKNKDNVKDAV